MYLLCISTLCFIAKYRSAWIYTKRLKNNVKNDQPRCLSELMVCGCKMYFVRGSVIQFRFVHLYSLGTGGSYTGHFQKNQHFRTIFLLVEIIVMFWYFWGSNADFRFPISRKKNYNHINVETFSNGHVKVVYDT